MRQADARPTAYVDVERTHQLPQVLYARLFWQPQPWSCRNEVVFFRCIGDRWGEERWRLHLAEPQQPLPAMTAAQRQSLAKALYEALNALVEGRRVVRFGPDLVMGLEHGEAPGGEDDDDDD